MKYIKQLLFCILFIVIFKWLTLSGFYLLVYSPQLQESSLNTLKNYYLTTGIVKDVVLIDEKYYQSENNPQSSTYKQTFEYEIETNNKIEKVKEIQEKRSKNLIITTYQVGDSISFYKNKDTIYDNLLIKKYQLKIENKDQNTFSTLGLVFFSIGLILNLIIGIMIYKSIKKELIV